VGGKTNRIKGDLDDIEAILEIITILKDVSTNRFFSFARKKEDFAKFLDIFLVFFNMLENVKTTCPLVKNDNPKTDIILITSEQSFMSQLNNRVCNAALKETEKYPEAKVFCVGWRGADKCKQLGLEIAETFSDIEKIGRYEVALQLRDRVIERVLAGESGRAVCVYIWAKSFNVLKPRIVKLLPADELIGGDEGALDEASPVQSAIRGKFISESSIDGIMKVLADIWVSCRLFEMISDSLLAEAAAQAQQLESAIESMSKDKKGLLLSFKKSQRGDLNKAMREVFTSSSVRKR
jgi:F-type H+-transporting ATPase subunit gamma